MSKIYIASDHAGFSLKESLRAYLESSHEVVDCGAFSLDPDDDYPPLVEVCAKRVAGEAGSFGVVIGASGQGEAIAANKVAGIRAAVYYGDPSKTQTDASGHTLSLIESVRSHNDANILSLGARFITEEEAQRAVEVFLATPASSDERHVRRRSLLG